MADNIIKVSVTASKSQRVNVSSAQVGTEITASSDTGKFWAQNSKNWAVSENIVDNEDYSSKYYANKAKTSAENAKSYSNSTREEHEKFIEDAIGYVNELNELKEAGGLQINEAVASGKDEINSTKTTAVNAVNTSKNQALNDIEKESSSIINFKEEVNAELENKVDLDDMVAFDMKEVPCIVETYSNGTSGYNIYSNGYCEQWGRVIPTSTGIKTVSLLKAFKNTDYIVTNSIYTTTALDLAYSYGVGNYKTNSFDFYCRSTGNTGYNCSWRACGYIA